VLARASYSTVVCFLSVLTQGLSLCGVRMLVLQRVRRMLLSLVRQGTCVVEAVCRWRETLWRQHAFMHNDVSYLQKMQTDTDFLFSADGARMLSGLGVAPEEAALCSLPATLMSSQPGAMASTVRSRACDVTLCGWCPHTCGGVELCVCVCVCVCVYPCDANVCVHCVCALCVYVYVQVRVCATALEESAHTRHVLCLVLPLLPHSCRKRLRASPPCARAWRLPQRNSPQNPHATCSCSSSHSASSRRVCSSRSCAGHRPQAGCGAWPSSEVGQLELELGPELASAAPHTRRTTTTTTTTRGRAGRRRARMEVGPRERQGHGYVQPVPRPPPLPNGSTLRRIVPTTGQASWTTSARSPRPRAPPLPPPHSPQLQLQMPLVVVSMKGGTAARN